MVDIFILETHAYYFLKFICTSEAQGDTSFLCLSFEGSTVVCSVLVRKELHFPASTAECLSLPDFEPSSLVPFLKCLVVFVELSDVYCRFNVLYSCKCCQCM